MVVIVIVEIVFVVGVLFWVLLNFAVVLFDVLLFPFEVGEVVSSL